MRQIERILQAQRQHPSSPTAGKIGSTHTTDPARPMAPWARSILRVTADPSVGTANVPFVCEEFISTRTVEELDAALALLEALSGKLFFSPLGRLSYVELVRVATQADVASTSKAVLLWRGLASWGRG